uniref:ribosomal protein S3 n=1 Tax=Pseudoceramium tenerrimum TaxID=196911 RepID=UPI002E768F4E|nr:ribosomal protein S3 [Pseudoceramium tenerrimum]WQF69700.1 ribosomal protein S3 [Pseudoceramium tenerrimum]WQF69736.1 ribosomal protein S3 [Pseudoceramium tenerrimum]
MAQKTNPTSVKLGQQFPWFITYQGYGKSLRNLPYYYYLTLNFSFFCSQLQSTAKYFNVYFTSKTTTFTINLISNNSEQNLFLKQANATIPKLFKKSTVQYFVIVSQLDFAVNISFLFKFLIEQKIMFRKATLILKKLLKLQLGKTKLVYLKFGVKKVKLHGFKFSLTGRFENTKNQMSKKIEYSEGSLSLISIQSETEFFTLNIYSKLGVCNFKIWLFYN